MDKEFDVYSIGNPLMDILVQVEDNFLEELDLNKGIMHLIDTDRQQEILSKIQNPTIAPGGSCANTAIHLADFGLKVIYSGAIGDDDIGDQFYSGMENRGTIAENPKKELPTGTSIILITPDAERTQNTYLGSCQLYSKEDVNVEAIRKSKYLYFTGYMWDTQNQKEALEYAIKIAKESDTKIVFDVADPFAVGRSKEDFLKIIENDAYFVLANFEEAKMMTGKEEISDMIAWFQERVPMAVIKDGGNGSYIFDQSNIYKIPIVEVDAIDTTGAGDSYASGVIYGLARSYDLERTGRIASYVAAKVVEQIGARLVISLKDTVDTI